MTFRPALENDRLWEGEMIRVQADGLAVLLVRVHGEVHGYQDACVHQGVPLSEGKLCGQILTCRAHLWQYDMTTGHGINPPTARLRRVRVRVRDGMIEIDTGEQTETDT